MALDEGEPVAQRAADFSGLGFMGGPMSANDELAWTQPVLALMREALEERVPVIGHCLGGQLLARAAGAAVTRNPVKEIGWVPVRIEDNEAARDWFGRHSATFDAFQWHGDTFAVPGGAVRILTGEHCANQAYVLDGRHLGLQCHMEITAEMIETWCRIGVGEIVENVGLSPAVQDALTIRTLMPKKLPRLTAVTERLYARWIRHLRT